MRIIPIKSETDYDAALAEISRLMDAEAGTPRGDRLDVLVTLVEAYESRHWSIDPPDPIDAIRLRMAELGLVRRDLEPLLGSRGRVSDILNRRRPLTLEMMRRLHAELRIPAESFFRTVASSATSPPTYKLRSDSKQGARKQSKPRLRYAGRSAAINAPSGVAEHHDAVLAETYLAKGKRKSAVKTTKTKLKG